MKKNTIAKGIITGMLVSFLIGTIFTIIVLMIIDFQTPSYNENGRPRMNCFAGLQYGIAIGLQILIFLLSLPAFLNLYPRIRQNKYVSLFSFFGGYVFYLLFYIIEFGFFISFFSIS